MLLPKPAVGNKFKKVGDPHFFFSPPFTHTMSAIYSADLLYKTDAQLQSLVSPEAKKKYETLPSEEIVAATKAALEAKNHKVTVVNTGAEALQLIKDTIPKGTEITSYGSTTLVRLISSFKGFGWFRPFFFFFLPADSNRSATATTRRALTPTGPTSAACSTPTRTPPRSRRSPPSASPPSSLSARSRPLPRLAR